MGISTSERQSQAWGVSSGRLAEARGSASALWQALSQVLQHMSHSKGAREAEIRCDNVKNDPPSESLTVMGELGIETETTLLNRLQEELQNRSATANLPRTHHRSSELRLLNPSAQTPSVAVILQAAGLVTLTRLTFSKIRPVSVPAIPPFADSGSPCQDTPCVTPISKRYMSPSFSEHLFLSSMQCTMSFVAARMTRGN